MNEIKIANITINEANKMIYSLKKAINILNMNKDIEIEIIEFKNRIIINARGNNKPQLLNVKKLCSKYYFIDNS